MMRFRDDKPNGNYKTVVESIIKSIADGVERDTVRSSTFLPFQCRAPVLIPFFQLIARSNSIRAAWKTRHGQPAAPGPPPPAQAAPPMHHALPPRPPQPTPAPAPYPGPPQGGVVYAGPPVETRFGPLANSPWSKVSGPTVVAGMQR